MQFKNKPISFNPEFKIGDVICPLVDPELKCIIVGIMIDKTDESGYVTAYRYQASRAGTFYWFETFEIEPAIIYKNNQ